MNSSENLMEANSIIQDLEDHRPIKKRKILVLGSPGVGKSAIVTRFMDDVFYDYYNPSLQTSYKKILNFNNETIELEIVDLEGQSEHTIISYSRFSYGISGYILSYSIENRQSFELIKIINNKLNCNFGRQDIPKILIANKSDLNNRREIPIEAGKYLAKELNCPFLECSARSRDNIDRVFHTILVEIDKFENDFDPRKINCRRMYEYFAKRENTMLMIFYMLMILNIIFAFLSMSYGFYIGIEAYQQLNLIFGSILLIGIWNGIFTSLGIYGLKIVKTNEKKLEYINYFIIGILVSLIFNVVTFFLYGLEINSNNLDIKIKDLLFYLPYLLATIIFLNLVSLFKAWVYKNILTYNLSRFVVN